MRRIFAHSIVIKVLDATFFTCFRVHRSHQLSCVFWTLRDCRTFQRDDDHESRIRLMVYRCRLYTYDLTSGYWTLNFSNSNANKPINTTANLWSYITFLEWLLCTCFKRVKFIFGSATNVSPCTSDAHARCVFFACDLHEFSSIHEVQHVKRAPEFVCWVSPLVGDAFTQACTDL